jgi:alpha 1,6-mannosyltransferase
LQGYALHTNPFLFRSPRLELLHLKPLIRHRNLQFVQWTIHFAPQHPIVLDVIRRVLETTDIYRARQIDEERERQRLGWGWKEGKGANMGQLDQGSRLGSLLTSEKQASSASNTVQPWESTRMQWVWTKGHWRFGWHWTSVEEWTGPAPWTDAIVS